MSVVLIEHWEQKPKTAVWYSADATSEDVKQAISHAKKSYSYLAGDNIELSADFFNDIVTHKELLRDVNTKKADLDNNKNYIVMPLIIDYLPPLGALQLEGSMKLNEADLEFVGALANLITVALDRYYKTRIEREFQEKKAETAWPLFIAIRIRLKTWKWKRNFVRRLFLY